MHKVYPVTKCQLPIEHHSDVIGVIDHPRRRRRLSSSGWRSDGHLLGLRWLLATIR